MSSAISIPARSSLVRASYGLLIAGTIAGTVTSVFNPGTSLLAAALIFGWSQIGGL
jgi:hypothetical protein